MKKIGIVPPAFLWDSEHTNNDFYRFGNSYAKRIYECGGIPFGMLAEDGLHISEKALDEMDAFVVCGGKRMWPYHYEVAEYAITHGKRYLGICMGMQLLYRYFGLADYKEKTGYVGNIADLYAAHQGEGFVSLNPVEGHAKGFLRDRLDECKHPIRLVPGTHIHRLFGTEVIHGVSSHNYCVHDPSDKLTVSGYTEDGTIEVIEYGEQAIGVQFHPEPDDTLRPLFEFICQ